MLTDIDKQLLKIAYDEAKSGFESGGCPIGSVLARGGQELSRVTTNASSRATRLRMARWMHCARPGGRKPIVIRFSTQP